MPTTKLTAKFTSFLFLLSFCASTAIGQSIDLTNAPAVLAPGSTHNISVGYNSPSAGLVQIQLFDSQWNKVDSDWKSTAAGSGNRTLKIEVPSGTTLGGGYFWQGLVYNPHWVKLHESEKTGVSIAVANSLDMSNVPATLVAGESYSISADYSSLQNGVVQLQLFDSSWNQIAQQWKPISAGDGTKTFSITVPANTPAGDDYQWQGLVYNAAWVKKFEKVTSASISETNPNGEWTPPGNWVLDWNDEFSGTGLPDKWYPLLGYNIDDFATKTEKGIRWSGATEDTSAMYSTKTGNHWLNGMGKLVLRIVADKTESNARGTKVEGAYLLSGYPLKWDPDPNYFTKWGGKFVSPKETPLYICARVRSDKVVGHSTWFAFWLFSETRAYDSNWTNGTEVDVIEIVKGAPEYMEHAFNVANHWNLTGGSKSKQFNSGSTPKPRELVDVTDDKYHVYGIEWTTEKMVCYVDGKKYYTFTENIPSDPQDMMMLLTMEFEKDSWDANQGDGRNSGPFVSDNAEMREMSRVYVDYVRVYKKQ